VNTEADELRTLSQDMLEAWAACARGDADPIGELARLCERVRLLDRAALLITRLEHRLEPPDGSTS